MGVRRESEKFYESMPGTMDRVERRREREYEGDEFDRSGLLPWLAVAAVIVLGLLFLGVMYASRLRPASPNTGGNNSTQNQGAQPAQQPAPKY